MTQQIVYMGNIQAPNFIAVYMYSPFPVIVSTIAGHHSISMQVTCASNGRSYTETRGVFDGVAEFDLARIAQLLVPDIDDVFSMNLSQDGEAAPYARLTMTLKANDGTELLTRELFGIYGAQDQTEERFGNQRRRIWMNYPQTLQIWKDSSDEMAIWGNYIEEDFYPALSLSPTAVDMVEMDLMLHLGEQGGQGLRKALMSGKPADISVTCRFGGVDTVGTRDYYNLKLVPDLAPRCSGTYLRWLHRDGTFGYWHFANGSTNTDAALRSAFNRKIEGNPAEAVDGTYRNSVKADFSEVRRVTIGTRCETQEDHDYLCGLVTSPVVERLITVNDEDRWQRVNVVAGSYARSARYDSPMIQDFELTIELPQRNTLSL